MIVKQNIFLCCRKKLAFRKTIITIEPPPAIYACSVSIYLFIALLCYFASIFHALTRSGLQRIMLQIFRTKGKCSRSLSCTQLCHWSWWTHLASMLPQLSYLVGLKPYYCNKFSFETFDVISVWLHSAINPSSTVCVSITDPGMTLKHRDLTVWGRFATRWYQSTR